MDILVSPNDLVLDLMYAFEPRVTPVSALSELLSSGGGGALSSFMSSPLRGRCRPSFYVFVVRTGSGGYIVYNTLYNSLVRLQDDEYDMFLDPGSCPEELLTDFVANGLFVSDAICERESYLALADIFMHGAGRELNLTITTTLKCNAHCPYCYERGAKTADMFPGAADKILHFIRDQKDHDKIHLTWFGGEPLLNTALIDEVSAGLSASGIEFSSFMITNGSLFGDPVFERLTDWHLEHVQISLDGTADIHDGVKSLHAAGADFYSIIHSARQLAKKKIHVAFRLNITKRNFDDILNLIDELDYIFASEPLVNYYPAFIVGTEDAFAPEEKTGCLKKLLAAIGDCRKITAETRFHSLPKTHSCHNSDPRSFTIDVFGNIFSCEHYVGRKERALCRLDGYSAPDDPRTKQPELDPACSECVFLPKCFGGCAANREAHDDPCLLERYLIPAYMALL